MNNRRLVKANIIQIDPLNCNSTIGYSIIKSLRRRGLYADMDLADCNRKITWGFNSRDGDETLRKIDKVIAMLREFRVEWEQVARKYGRRRRTRKRRA